MSDEKCSKYIDGVAVHWYLDFIVPVKVLNEVHNDFGDKILINTEASQGEWSIMQFCPDKHTTEMLIGALRDSFILTFKGKSE